MRAGTVIAPEAIVPLDVAIGRSLAFWFTVIHTIVLFIVQSTILHTILAIPIPTMSIIILIITTALRFRLLLWPAQVFKWQWRRHYLGAFTKECRY